MKALDSLEKPAL